jgi:hypothetical protein
LLAAGKHVPAATPIVHYLVHPFAMLQSPSWHPIFNALGERPMVNTTHTRANKHPANAEVNNSTNNNTGTMSDQLREVKKVHDIYPDEPDTTPTTPPAQREGILVNGSVNRARRRPSRVPRPESMSYPAFKAKQEFALKIGVHGLQEEVAKSTGVGKMEVLKEKLTVHFRSQSKLSQQELSDLQKATHFDKKELQQWYKGELSTIFAHSVWNKQVLTNIRLPKGLP